MKIIFVFHRFHTNQFFFTKILKEKGHDVHYYVKYKDKAEDYSYIKPEIIENSKFSNFIYKLYKSIKKDVKRDTWKGITFPSPIVLYRKLKKDKPDLIIIRDFSVTSLVTIAISKICGLNCYSYISRPKYKKGGGTIATFIYRLLRFIELLPRVVITPVYGDPGDYTYTSKHTYFLPHCVEINKKVFNRKYFNNNKINILTIGKFSLKRKNHLIFLQLIKELSKQYDISATITGSYNNNNKNDIEIFNEVKSFIINNKLQKIIKIKTDIPFKEMFNEYLKNDIYVFPSVNEPNGVSHLEAMSCGLPVIVSDSNGTKDYMQDGYNGYIFKGGDLKDLIAKTKKIIKTRENIVKMGKGSLELVKTNFLPEKVYNDFLEIIMNESKGIKFAINNKKNKRTK